LSSCDEPFLKPGLERKLNGPFICGSAWPTDNGSVRQNPSPTAPLPSALTRFVFASALVLSLLIAGVPARGSDRYDHDRARAALKAGEVMPLSTLLERLQKTHPGQVLDLELEREDGHWIYEIKLLHSNGQLLKLVVDARTGSVLTVRQRHSDGKRSGKEGAR
jgi:Peptidase propeptide and YPEB domain